MKASSGENKTNYEPIEEGNISAICCGYIDLGKSINDFNGNEQWKVRLIWEVASTYEKDEKTYNRQISEDFTISFHEKANLRKTIESWLGKKFPKGEKVDFEISDLIDKPCLLNITHKKSKTSDRIFANVESVTPLPKGMPPLARIQDVLTFDFTDEDGKLRPKNEVAPEIDKLPEYIQNIIKKSITYNEVMGLPRNANVEEGLPF